jgi:type I restriction enzyme M protein
MVGNHSEIEKRLWDAADQLRANSNLKSSEYSVPVLGLIFLRYADHRFTQAQAELEGRGTGRHMVGKMDYQAKGVVFLPEKARFSYLLKLPEGENIGKAINEAMKLAEEENDDLRDVLPKNYGEFDNDLLVALLKNFSQIPMTAEGDAFGRIYEYFLGKFAMSEGAKGGEFYTPASIVKLIVEIIEPFHGRIFDPASGSGGMFVQSARFVERHRKRPSDEISIYGQEKTKETVRLCKMNLVVHGLSGDIKQSNTYYEDVHESVSKFDFVMANPPFNVDGVDKAKLKGDPRYPLGFPTVDNANYLWIQVFYSALGKNGRAGFVMANSAADARGSELEILKKLLHSGVVDVVVAVGSNFFYTVTLPVTLWFLDKCKGETPRKDKILFIDARNLYRQIDRAHREWTPEQVDFFANIVRLYRGEQPEFQGSTDSLFKEKFADRSYNDVVGLCKVASLKEVEEQGWSLNPGRYVGISSGESQDFDFMERLEKLNEDLELLHADARRLEARISENVEHISRSS